MAITQRKKNDLVYLTAEGISVPHGFTTRLGGVSQGSFAGLNIAHHRGDSRENVEKNHKLLADCLGYSPEKVVMTHQVHSDIILPVTETDCRGLDHHLYPQCDGLITNTPGVALVIFTADCTPILLHDPVTGAVGAVHAGWRGTAMDIAGKAVRAMAENFGCQPENIRAAIGPNIGPCCFETHEDVPLAMVETYGEEAKKWIRPSGDKYYVNLKELNRLSLSRAGVPWVEVSPVCTCCQPEQFWSHRKTGADRGSQGAVILCEEKER